MGRWLSQIPHYVDPGRHAYFNPSTTTLAVAGYVGQIGDVMPAAAAIFCPAPVQSPGSATSRRGTIRGLGALRHGALFSEIQNDAGDLTDHEARVLIANHPTKERWSPP